MGRIGVIWGVLLYGSVCIMLAWLAPVLAFPWAVAGAVLIVLSSIEEGGNRDAGDGVDKHSRRR